MGYTALYRKFRPGGFEEVKGHSDYVKKSDSGRSDRSCLFVLWDKRNRKNLRSKDFGKGGQL